MEQMKKNRPIVWSEMMQPSTSAKAGYGIHPRSPTPECRSPTPMPSPLFPTTLIQPRSHTPECRSPTQTPSPSPPPTLSGPNAVWPPLPLSPPAPLPPMPTTPFPTTRRKIWTCPVCKTVYEGKKASYKGIRNHLQRCKKKNNKKNHNI